MGIFVNRSEFSVMVVMYHLYSLFGTGIVLVAAEDRRCPSDAYANSNYGTFVFPETIASLEGTEVKVACPGGFRYDGQEDFSSGQQDSRESKEAESGIKRKCMLPANSSDEPFWYPNRKSELRDNMRYCRKQFVAERIFMWTEAIQRTHCGAGQFHICYAILDDLRPEIPGDYDCAAAVFSGIEQILSYSINNPNFLSKEDRESVNRELNNVIQSIASSLHAGFKFQLNEGGIFVETAKFRGLHLFAKARQSSNYEIHAETYYSEFSAQEAESVQITISTDAIQMAMQNNVTASPKLQMKWYSEEVFLALLEESTTKPEPEETFFNETTECIQTEDFDCIEGKRQWFHLTIELDGEIKNLKEPIVFSVINRTIKENFLITCIYEESPGIWTSDGVKTIEIPDGVQCESTHLSAFSALLEPLPLPFPGAEYAPVNNSIHKYILSILSSIGSICSIIGLALTLLTYGLFRSLRRERSNRILINLCTSLLLMHIMSVSAEKSIWDGHCFIPAASLHYFVLTSLSWMMVEAVQMYELLISVFVRPENRFLIKRVILAWGCPLLTVVVCAAVDPSVYFASRGDLCLISAYENIIIYYAAYIGPICCMLFVNMFVFCRIFRVLYNQTKRDKATKDGNMSKYRFVKISPSQIKGATTIMILFGIGWILGLMAIGPMEVVFRYLFCICNAGQGLFIFIFRVLLHPHACNQWRKVILGMSPDTSLDASVSSSSTGFARRWKRKNTIITPTLVSTTNSVQNSLTASNPMAATLRSSLAAILRSTDNEKKDPVMNSDFS